ncbi:MAG TPA: 2-oxoacid:acceptor oxidoreductase subunit alpha [Candidatus Thermoplasmatota archaeon]|nr:2-oxoacid:acceptor oxidoreductase subunit alpha [Candidatus Thermoplasmatota archaeon]
MAGRGAATGAGGAAPPGHGVAWLIAGTAGEGLESGGDTFARALAALGYRPTTQRDFPSRIRGGDTTFTVRLTSEGRLVPPGRIDLALAFNDTVLPRLDVRMGPGCLLLVDEGKGGAFVPGSGCAVEPFPFTALATAAGLAKAKNMVALGASSALMGVDLATLSAAVDDQFRSKGDKVVEQNRKALQAGHDEAVRRYGSKPRFAAPTPEKGAALLLSGNEAASLGALAAGCRVAAAYPITPASDILEYLTPRLQALGGTALQMEDELAAVNVLIGAGFAGAKAITATSGPGLSLMTEALGFAGSAEVPIVVVDCQRPGPSTGMPTKHGQEDLWHLVHGGHGEHVRIVLSPTDVSDAFHVTAEAFRLAERFRAPAFVALDQQASLFRQTVAPFDVEAAAKRQDVRKPNTLPPDANAWDRSYNAYFGDGSEHPVRVAIPGETGGRHYANSTEHAPSGFTNEDPKVRADMVARRLRRMQAIVEEADRPVLVEGEATQADVVLLSWGSTVEACREAADRLRAQGRKPRVVGIRLLWPFPNAAVKAALGDKAPILCVEANGFGQLARLVKSELPVHDRLTSLAVSDGRPIPSDTVLEAAR